MSVRVADCEALIGTGINHIYFIAFILNQNDMGFLSLHMEMCFIFSYNQSFKK